jgi:hypothetical protein
MANIIRIKRRASIGSTGAPSSLKNAELAFNEADNTLYYGFGDDGSGDATSIPAIGGSGAFVTLSSNQTISGDKTFTGTVSLGSSATATTQSAGNNSTSLATTAYVDNAVTTATYTFTLAGDGGSSQAIDDEETVTIAGGTAITTTAGATNTLTIDLDNTAVTPGNYGSATSIPTFTVDQQGRLTAAGSASISTTLTVDADGATSENVALASDDLRIVGGTGITTSVSKASTDVTVTISGDDATTSSKGIASFSSSDFSVSTGAVSISNVNLGTQTTGDYVDKLVAGTGVTLLNNSGEGATPTVSIGQAVGTTDNVSFNSITTTGAASNNTIGGNLVVTGNLTVNGDTTTVNTATLSVEDPLIVLANGNNSTDSVDIGFYGLYDTSGSQDLYAGFFRDASDGKFKIFKDSQSAPTTTIDTGAAGYGVATLVADLEGTILTASQTNITGIGTITTGTWEATDVAILHGGTGASTASDARINLGLEIGVDVQAYDAGLADISGLTPTDSYFIVGDGTNWVTETGSTVRSSLGLGTIAVQNSNNVTITGGSISSVSLDLVTIDGGTF